MGAVKSGYWPTDASEKPPINGGVVVCYWVRQDCLSDLAVINASVRWQRWPRLPLSHAERMPHLPEREAGCRISQNARQLSLGQL